MTIGLAPDKAALPPIVRSPSAPMSGIDPGSRSAGSGVFEKARVRMSSLRCVAYVSAAVRELSTAELEALLIRSRAENLASGITGVLLYSDGGFIQCFEGPEAAVADTYARIKASRLHHGLVELMNQPVDARSFQGFEMALASATRSEFLALSTARWSAQANASVQESTGRDGWGLMRAFWRDWRAG